MLETVGVKDVLMQVASGDLDKESLEKTASVAFGRPSSREELDSLLAQWDSSAKDYGNKEMSQVLRGYCLLISGKAGEAVEVLRGVKRNPWGAYSLARALAEENRLAEALQVADQARRKDPDNRDLAYLVAELRCRLRDPEGAAEIVKELRKTEESTANFVFHEAYLLERSGEYAEAIEKYREAVHRNPRFAEAYFRLGYLLELHGTDADEANDEAVSAYESCVKLTPVHANAVINLGLQYEDRERYHDAIKCYEVVLRAYPNHERARLYLKDAQASTLMFYDREQEKKADKQSQVLKIPVSDFELSVRSRNCLQKMDIQTLGDLIMKTERELLSYKNFGETSLTEIKEMLAQKDLRLGQGLESTSGDVPIGRNPLEATAPPEVLAKPIEELNLSVRSRRCMERLEVRSVRDLINKTEVELMSAKNFGMTSLNEIKRVLAELGLSLRS